MITSWKIMNFKAIASALLNISEGSINVVSGVNSIGKSSLIQSMLFVTQSVESRRIELNGRLVRLGDGDDVITVGGDGAGSNIVSLSMEFKKRDPRTGLVEYGHTRSMSFDLELGYCRDVFPEDGLIIKEMRVPFTPIYRKTISDSLSSDVIADLASGCQPEGEEFILKASHIKLPKLLANEIDLEDRQIMRICAKASTETPTPACTTYVVMDGFLPTAIVFRMQLAWLRHTYDKELRSIVETLVAFQLGVLSPSASARTQERLTSSLFRELYQEAYGGIGADVNELPHAGDELSSEYLYRLVNEAVGRRENQPWVLVNLTENLESTGYAADGLLERACLEAHSSLIDGLTSISSELKEFAKALNYIGPIREEPRPVAEVWEEYDVNLPVGRRGERAAHVLQTRAGIEVACGLPPENDDACAYVEPRKSTLGRSVSQWASYIGLGDSLSTESYGNIGTQLCIGSYHRDLTMVGVGVSQLAPVLIGVLTADPNSVILLEQPELHLHPSAQSKLADFLLFARQDVSFVVETHSAALITRLRRRAAESDLNGGRGILLGRMRIIFVEAQDDGLSVTRTLSFDSYGNLSDWPKGFLDTIESDTAKILDANRRRRRQRGNAR